MLKKRFIAGAVCPRCGLMDKIISYRTETALYRECVSCHFKDRMEEPEQFQEIQTRVSPAPEPDPDVQKVRIIDPSAKP